MGNSPLGFQMRTPQELAYLAMRFLSENFWKVLGGFLIVVGGWVTAKVVGKLLQSFLARRQADVTITKFFIDFLKASIFIFAVLIALGNFGVTIAPLIAGLGVVGFGTSFALQGPLSNYAAGATLVFTKPFKVGDILEVGDWTGKVEDMTLARTMIRTLDGTLVVIPNRRIIGEVLHNCSQFKLLEIKVGISYQSNADRAIAIMKEIVAGEKRVSGRPAPKIGISEFGDSSVNLYARIWCGQADYWDLLFGLNKSIYDEFRKQAITIPFPQRDVHMIGEKRV